MRRKALAIRFIDLIYKITARLYIHAGLFIVTNLWGRGLRWISGWSPLPSRVFEPRFKRYEGRP